LTYINARARYCIERLIALAARHKIPAMGGANKPKTLRGFVVTMERQGNLRR
jgi:hypothetical protein